LTFHNLPLFVYAGVFSFAVGARVRVNHSLAQPHLLASGCCRFSATAVYKTMSTSSSGQTGSSEDGPVEPAQPDQYFNLGLTEYATLADIKKAFHRLALLHHRDKKAPGTTSDAAKFHKVSSFGDFQY
jgi:hypothetical protein